MQYMNSDYYTLDNGRQIVDYIAEYQLGFHYGNAAKYVCRAGRKEGNSAEKDLNKALNYVLSANHENGFIKRLLLHFYNSWKFNAQTQFATRSIADILCALITFEDNKKIARMIVKYMDAHDIKVKDEYRKCI